MTLMYDLSVRVRHMHLSVATLIATKRMQHVHLTIATLVALESFQVIHLCCPLVAMHEACDTCSPGYCHSGGMHNAYNS